MADSAHLEKLADSFPPHAGWFCQDKDTDTVLTFVGRLLNHHPHHFPLAARVRIYDGGRLIATSWIADIKYEDHKLFAFRDVLDQPVTDGFFEVSIVPLNDSGMKVPYFGELWCSVVSRDGRTAINFPPLNTRGVDTVLTDNRLLYYPGVLVNQQWDAALVMMSHYDFEITYDLALSNASGTRTLSKKVSLPAKTAQRLVLSEYFDKEREIFAEGPVLLAVKFPYKLNGYVQTINAAKKNICGMDHLGLFLGYGQEPEVPLEQVVHHNNNRLTDRVVCFCKSVTHSELTQMAVAGHSLEATMSRCGAGTVCMGCVPELESLFCSTKAHL